MATQFATGQQAATGSAAALNGGVSTNFTNGIKLTCLSSSVSSVFVGGSAVTTSTGDELPAGQSVILPINDLSTLYIVTAGTASVSWLALV